MGAVLSLHRAATAALAAAAEVHRNLALVRRPGLLRAGQASRALRRGGLCRARRHERPSDQARRRGHRLLHGLSAVSDARADRVGPVGARVVRYFSGTSTMTANLSSVV